MTKYWVICGGNRALFDSLGEAAEIYKQLTHYFDPLCRKQVIELSETAKSLAGDQKDPKISFEAGSNQPCGIRKELDCRLDD